MSTRFAQMVVSPPAGSPDGAVAPARSEAPRPPTPPEVAGPPRPLVVGMRFVGAPGGETGAAPGPSDPDRSASGGRSVPGGRDGPADWRGWPTWALAIVGAVEAHPRFSVVPMAPLAGRARAARARERIVPLVLRWMDRPVPATAHPAVAERPVPRAARATDASGCDVIIDLVPAGVRPAAEVGPPNAGGAAHWRVEADVVSADAEAALLAGLELSDVALHERVPDAAEGADDRSAWRVRTVHSLPAQSFSPSDRRAAAFGALPAFVTAALVRFAAGTSDVPVDAPRQRRLAGLRAGTGNVGRRRVAALRLARRWMRARALDRYSEECWELAWHPDSPATDASATESLLRRPVSAWLPLLEDPGLVRADPHALVGETGIDLWFEEMSRGTQRAHVAHVRCAPPRAGASALELLQGPAIALESAHHLSYPFAFEHAGTRRMVPETARAGRVELYREGGSPTCWRRERALLDGSDTTDTTLLHRDGRWWLFTNAMSHAAVDERDLLLLYFADALEGPWTPHPGNPVARGVDRARMAGALFELDGQLVRPSQYGGTRYGHGLQLNRVTALDTRRYAEESLGRILPEPGGEWLGMHSISRAGGATFVDRLRRRPRLGPGMARGRPKPLG